jgi:metallophosphoesterase (TIGR00282 family)
LRFSKFGPLSQPDSRVVTKPASGGQAGFVRRRLSLAAKPATQTPNTNLLAPEVTPLTLCLVKLLFIGDIVGEPGRRAIKTLVPLLRLQHRLDAVIANGENSAGGSGITTKIADEIFSAGVDAITTGDHLWDQKEVTLLLEKEPRFLRPLNYPPGTLGQGSHLFQLDGRPPFAVLNVQGRVFMPDLDNPFTVIRPEITRLRTQTKVILVDFHAEATSEKIALARMLDGSVSAVIGTHTHVQTADEQIFPGGTAFLCDAGFTGPHESVLGREIEPVIRRFVTHVPQRFEVAKERLLLQGALIDVDEATGRARNIQRISESLS